jgi:hypothetical protein
MTLFVAALVAARRGGRSSTVVVPMRTPPLWQMIVEEIVNATRRALARLSGRAKWHHRRTD